MDCTWKALQGVQRPTPALKKRLLEVSGSGNSFSQWSFDLWPWVFIFYNLNPKNTYKVMILTTEKSHHNPHRMRLSCRPPYQSFYLHSCATEFKSFSALSSVCIISLHYKWKVYIYISFPMEPYVPEFLYIFNNFKPKSLKMEWNKTCFPSIVTYPIVLHNVLHTQHHKQLILTLRAKSCFLWYASNLSKV